MFRLIRFLISLAMTAAFLWFAVSVPLGKRTLWGHLRAIFSTPEAKDLAEGTREEAERVADRVRQELHPLDMSAPRRVKAPLETVDDSERHKPSHVVKPKPR
jgi:hypothetical protein